MPNPIGWCDETLNLYVGCTKCSPGCDHCYAERMARRLAAMGISHYTNVVDAAGHWTGHIGVAPDDTWNKPFHWRKPRTIFVNSMGDAFHPNVPDSLIDRVLAIAAMTPWHTYILCTKRADRMMAYFRSRRGAVDIARGGKIIGRRVTIPSRNVIGLVTVCNQAEADAKIPFLLNTPLAYRGVSIEPMLERIIIPPEMLSRLSWVVCGGETGPGARSIRPEWVRSVRDQCEAAGVPFWFKKWGDNPHPEAYLERDGMKNAVWQHGGRWLDGRLHDGRPEVKYG